MATVVHLLLAYSGSDYDDWGFKLNWNLIKNVFRRTVAASVFESFLPIFTVCGLTCVAPCVCRVITKFWAKANCPSSPWSSRPSSSAAGPRRRSRLLEEPACWWHRAPLTLFLQNKLCKWGILVCFHATCAAQLLLRIYRRLSNLGTVFIHLKMFMPRRQASRKYTFNCQITFLD